MKKIEVDRVIAKKMAQKPNNLKENKLRLKGGIAVDFDDMFDARCSMDAQRRPFVYFKLFILMRIDKRSFG